MNGRSSVPDDRTHCGLARSGTGPCTRHQHGFSRMINRLMLKMAISLGTHEVKPECHFNRGSQATLVEGDLARVTASN